MRSVSTQNNEGGEQQHHHHQRTADSSRNTPVPWDPQTGQDRPNSGGSNHGQDSAKEMEPLRERQQREREKEARESQRERVERYGAPRPQHARNESRDTGGIASSGEYGDHATSGRRHDYDVQSMETALSSPRTSMIKNPIPAPTVTVRSEYPTLTRSRQQQSLTCLVTIEVPEGKWRPDPADLRGAPVLPSMQQDSNTFSNSSRPLSPTMQSPRTNTWQAESPEVLEEITEDLRVRVDNWHGLDFQR